MTHRKLVVAGTVVALALGGGGAAMAATTAKAPKSATVKESATTKYKINRWVQDGLRWNRDVYHVRSGGTIRVVSNKEAPHTFTVVRKKDEPRTAKEIDNCLSKGHICLKLAIAHGANPESEAPPQFQFLENGTGTNTPPNLDHAGDSAFVPDAHAINLKVTAKKGTTLRFMCLIHPWMQAKVEVG
jgi:plastocyanin